MLTSIAGNGQCTNGFQQPLIRLLNLGTIVHPFSNLPINFRDMFFWRAQSLAISRKHFTSFQFSLNGMRRLSRPLSTQLVSRQVGPCLHLPKKTKRRATAIEILGKSKLIKMVTLQPTQMSRKLMIWRNTEDSQDRQMDYITQNLREVAEKWVRQQAPLHERKWTSRYDS